MTSTTNLTIAIVGTGIGGTEMAGYLGAHGHRVRVHDVRAEAVSAIRERGGLEVSGIATGFAKIERATTDLAERRGAAEGEPSGHGNEWLAERAQPSTARTSSRWRR